MPTSATQNKCISIYFSLYILNRSMGILLPPVSQVTNTRINLTQHHRNRSLDSALQRIPEVSSSAPTHLHMLTRSYAHTHTLKTGRNLCSCIGFSDLADTQQWNWETRKQQNRTHTRTRKQSTAVWRFVCTLAGVIALDDDTKMIRSHCSPTVLV